MHVRPIPPAVLRPAALALAVLALTALSCSQPPGGRALSPAPAADSSAAPFTLSAPLRPDFPHNVPEDKFNDLRAGFVTPDGFNYNERFVKARRLLDVYSWQTFLALNWPVGEERLLFTAAPSRLSDLSRCADGRSGACPSPQSGQCLPVQTRQLFTERGIRFAGNTLVCEIEPGRTWEVYDSLAQLRPYVIRHEAGRLNVYDNRPPKPKLTDEGVPWWATWQEAPAVFRPDGTRPAGWYAERPWPASVPESLQTSPALNRLRALQRLEILSTTHKAGQLDAFDQTQDHDDEAVWDQNGNMVYYAIRLNRPMFDYLVKNHFYNLDGQVAWAGSHQGGSAVVPEPPWGNTLQPYAIGVVEIKTAWRLLGATDLRSRYLTRQALVRDEHGGWSRQEVGLVGLHVAHKTATHKDWIWSTFEHVDNVQADPLALLAAGGRLLKPSFHDPACDTCAVNVPPGPDASGVRRTQVQRVVPIAEETAALNRTVQELLRAEGSVLQYYELVGTQWPLQGVLANGSYTPLNLGNTVLETYLQAGNQYERKGRDSTLVFRTSSCMGCHRYAPLAVGFTERNDSVLVTYSAAPQSANYSWLLQKAHPCYDRRAAPECRPPAP